MSSGDLTGKKSSDKTGEGEALAQNLFGLVGSDTALEIVYEPNEDGFDWDESVDVRLERPVKSNTQIRDLGDENYNLAEPILITIEEYLDEDVVIASWPEIEAFAEGATETEAIGNLKLEILDLYEELIGSDPSELGAKPTAWLRILSQLITMV